MKRAGAGGSLLRMRSLQQKKDLSFAVVAPQTLIHSFQLLLEYDVPSVSPLLPLYAAKTAAAADSNWCGACV